MHGFHYPPQYKDLRINLAQEQYRESDRTIFTQAGRFSIAMVRKISRM